MNEVIHTVRDACPDAVADAVIFDLKVLAIMGTFERDQESERICQSENLRA